MVLHLVRLAGKPVGPKLERGKAFEYPVWTVPTPCGYLIWAHPVEPEGACKVKGGNNRRRLGQCSFFPMRCVRA